ncbi:MAG TPA: hypothetical protein VFE63_02035 [Roseiarcus sp.]|jgi:hypothetical protein|nr:hypothetical protein [Roseiarcus sp.]
MIRAIIGILALLAAVPLAHAAGGPAEDSIYGTPAEARWAPLHANYANVPACEDLRVLSKITLRFDDTENEYWGGQHSIGGFERIREIGFRSNGLDYIPRRYCVARALVIDRRAPPPQRPRARTTIYQVGASTGPLGMMWGVEWCVVGFDRELAYDTHFDAPAYAPGCASVRPIIERRIGVLKEVDWFGEYGLKARY